MNDLPAVVRLFGPAARRGPFELLGLEPALTDPGAVRAAAERRRAVLASGRYEALDVIEAQEAIAAAEALLLDAEHQREVLAACALATEPPHRERAPAVPAEARRVARALLARTGRWNARVAVQIGAVATRAGVPPALLIEAARTPLHLRAAPPATAPLRPAAAPTHAVPAPRPAVEPPPASGVVIAGLIAVVLSLVVLIVATRSRPRPEPAATAPPAPAVLDSAPVLDAFEDLERAASAPSTTLGSLLDAMRGAADELGSDPADAAWRMTEALEAFSRRWTEADDDELDEVNRMVRAYLAAAAPGGRAARRVAGFIAAPRGEARSASVSGAAVTQEVWSAGVVAVLAADPGIPEATRETFQSGAAGFSAGARAGLGVIAREMARAAAEPDGDAWPAWITALDRVYSGRALAGPKQSVVLGAIEEILLGPLPPSRAETSLAAVTALIERAGWGGSRAPAARARVLGWLDDPRVSSIDLSILMRLSGVPELVAPELPPSAGPETRSARRDGLARAWGMGAAPVPREKLREDWARASAAVESQTGSDPIDRLHRCVALARLLGAAPMVWAGELGPAADALRRVTAPVPAGPHPRSPSAAGTDGRWTIEYHTVRRSGEGALAALDRLRGRGALGPVDARTLAHVALLGSPMQVRRRAQEIVADRAEETELLAAVLELLPRAPRTPRVGQMIESLTSVTLGSPRAEGWMLGARRALVARLLDALAADDAAARAQELADALRGALTPTGARAGPPPVDAAAALAEISDGFLERAHATGVALALDAENTRRRRDGRRRVAFGPVQRAVVESSALVEILAALTRAERPSHESAVQRLLDDTALLDGRANDSVEQLEINLSAARTLWGIRLGYAEDQPADPPMGAAGSAGRPGSWWRVAFSSAALAAPLRAGGAGEEALMELDPAEPAGYLRLAEEIAYERTDSAGLARRLCLLAMALDRNGNVYGPVAASAAVLLADLSPDRDQRRWLLALADTFGARAGVLRWDTGRREAFDTRLAAAEVLGLSRGEDNRRAEERLAQPGVREELAAVERAIPGGLASLVHRIGHAPSCPECRNERVVRSEQNPQEWVLCYTCRGLPRPLVDREMLIAELRAERFLLGADHDWGVEITVRGLPPARDLTIREAAAVYGVDLTETVFRGGVWVAPR